MNPSAETFYFFRHAIVRDAAYELLPPSARAALHGLSIAAFENALGNIAVQFASGEPYQRQALDPYASALATHATLAVEQGLSEFIERRDHYLVRAGLFADGNLRHDEAFVHWSRLLESTEAPDLRILAAHRLGHNESSRDRHSAAEMWQRRVIEQYSALENPPPRLKHIAVNARISLAYAHLNTGRTTEAVELAEVAISEAGDDVAMRAKALKAKGDFQMRLGMLDDAARDLRRALDLEGIDAGDRSTLMTSLAVVYHEQGRDDEALELLERGLLLSEEIGFKYAQATQRTNKVAVLHALGRYRESADASEQALQLVREVGDRMGEGLVLNNLCNARRELGETDGLDQAYQRAQSIGREIGNWRLVSLATGNSGDFLSEQGRSDEAAAALEEALSAARQAGAPRLEGGWLCTLAAHFERIGRREQAAAAWREGAGILKEKAPALLKQLQVKMRELCEANGHDSSIYEAQ